MVARISSFHMYQGVQNDLRRQEAKIAHNQEQLASGKQLLNASEDPLATHYVQGINQQSEQLEQYMDAIVLTRNRLEQHEVLVANAEEYADEARLKVMEMINGSHSENDRLAIVQVISQLYDNLLQLSNSQDESGNYIYSGTKARSQPFFRDKSGEVTYTGDDYQRKMRISDQIEMPLNDPGSKVFMEIDNPYGAYSPTYLLQEGSELLLEEATNTDYLDDSNYSVTFVDMGNGKYGYQLEQDGTVVKADEFDPVTGIQHEELTITIKGEINPGDRIELAPQRTISLFDSFNDAIGLANSSVSSESATAELQRVASELYAGFVHLGKIRTEVGARMNTVDNQEEIHMDFKVTLGKSKSAFEDLDYSQAVIEFNENTLALQASQKAFSKTKELTLFNYL